MQTIGKGERKVLNQYITVYQSIIEFSLEKIGLEVIVKHNKQDPDNMLDDINAKLIEVADGYLQDHKLGLDKFQLATVVADLWSQTISELDEPFKVIAKESKTLVQEYLEKNKSKREALERIKKENDELDEEIAQQKKINRKKNIKASEVDFDEKPEMPRKNSEAGGLGGIAPTPKPKPRARGTDALAMKIDLPFK